MAQSVRQHVRAQRHRRHPQALPPGPGPPPRPSPPDPSKATGAAVIVAPGGGFRTLSMENEGWNVARALADKGVAAFALKYRLNKTPADTPRCERREGA